MNAETVAASPKLLKARIKHSRYAMLALLPLILLTAPLSAHDSLLRGLMMLAGYALVIAGAFGRAYCSLYIGGRKNDELMRDGPFGVVRNPLYVFSFLATVGIGLQSGSFIIAAILIGAFAFYYPMVVAKEEAFLAHKFGEPYQAYLREVPRWKPDMSKWTEPEAVPCKPGFVRKTMLDASVFFLPLPCFFMIEWLHASGVLPVLFRLP